MASICGKPMIAWIIQQAWLIEGIDDVYVLTSGLEEDNPLGEAAIEYGATNAWRGPENDLLRRQVEAMEATKTDIFCEMSGDTPIVQLPIANRMLKAAREHPSHDAYSANHPQTHTFGEGTPAVRRRSWFEKVAGWYKDHPEEFVSRREQFWNAENDFPNCFKFDTHVSDISDIEIREKTPIKTSIDYEFELHMMEYVAGEVGHFPLTIDEYKDAYRQIGPIRGTKRWWDDEGS